MDYGCTRSKQFTAREGSPGMRKLCCLARRCGVLGVLRPAGHPRRPRVAEHADLALRSQKCRRIWSWSRIAVDPGRAQTGRVFISDGSVYFAAPESHDCPGLGPELRVLPWKRPKSPPS